MASYTLHTGWKCARWAVRIAVYVLDRMLVTDGMEEGVAEAKPLDHDRREEDLWDLLFSDCMSIGYTFFEIAPLPSHLHQRPVRCSLCLSSFSKKKTDRTAIASSHLVV